MKTVKNATVEVVPGKNMESPSERAKWNRERLERTLWPEGEPCRLVNAEELDSILTSKWPRKWLESIAPYGNVQRTMLIYTPDEARDPMVKVKFYTENHEYTITIIDCPKDGTRKRGYLGCDAQSRKERPGETWKRGCDLPDGPFELETWEKIKQAIIAHEIKNLQVEL